MDEALRKLERQALSGDPEAIARLGRMREKMLLPLRSFTVHDGEGSEDEILARTWKEARRLAREWIRYGPWDIENETIWVDVYLYESDDDDDVERITVTIDPEEPDCEVDGDVNYDHDWEDGQAYGSGGVVITDTCRLCGLERTTDTWAQRRDTGEQGLDSVRYDEPDNLQYQRNPDNVWYLILWDDEYDDFKNLGINWLAQQRLGTIASAQQAFEEQYQIQIPNIESRVDDLQRRIKYLRSKLSLYQRSTPALREEMRNNKKYNQLRDLMPVEALMKHIVADTQKVINELISEQRILLGSNQGLTKTLVFDTYTRAVDHIIHYCVSVDTFKFPGEICGHVVEVDINLIPPESIGATGTGGKGSAHILGWISEDALGKASPVFLPSVDGF